MRSAQKQEVLGLIESLHQAHEEIKEALSQKKQALAQNMIAECQEFAVSLGENIERLECEGHITVSYVEEYCETLFHIHEELAGNLYNENKIPISYYDKNPDGSFREMQYEADQYPADIPITRYDEYDFEKRRPNVIFIHNPYDNYNLVASVHPFFYSNNLKKYIENISFETYNESSYLIKAVERFRERIGHYPKCVLADQVPMQKLIRNKSIKIIRKESKWNVAMVWAELSPN